MPLYEYHCGHCGTFEVIRKFSDPALTACPTCGAEIEKLLSAPAIQFKGSGWYITDYARKGGNGNGGGKSEKADKGEKSAEKSSSEKSSSDSSSTSSPSSSPSSTPGSSGSTPAA